MTNIETAAQELNRYIGDVQSRQGSAGCYMELLRYARSAAGVIVSQSYMFTDPAEQLSGIRSALENLPPNQSDGIVKERSARIKKLLTATVKI